MVKQGEFGDTGDEFLLGFAHYCAVQIRKLVGRLPGLSDDAVYQRLLSKHGDGDVRMLLHLRVCETIARGEADGS